MTPQQAFAEAMKFENRANPYPFFDELRKTPVADVGNGVYAVSGYREVYALASDPRVSSDTRNSNLIKDATAGAPPKPATESPDAYGGNDPSMIGSDPPDHDRMRRTAMKYFGAPHSPRVIPDMEPACQQIVNGLLDKASGKTRIDLVDEFAYPLPVTVICKIMGVPLADEPRLHDWIAEMMAAVDLGPEATTDEQKARLAKGRQSGAEFRRYLTELVGSVIKQPGQGMISQMANEQDPAARMTPSELVANAALIFVAGHDSTVNLISHCVLTVLRNPGSIDMLRRQPELVPRAIEEVLRLQSSVQFFPSRSALADIEIGGVVIPNGAPILLLYGAANRDPKRFDNPNRFDPERAYKEHMGWGGGVHVCFGGALARLEVNTAFEAFLRRVENPRLVVDPPPYRPSQIFRGPRHLLIDFDEITD